MRVLPKSQLGIRMPKLLRHETDTSTRFKSERCIGVAAVVKAKRADPLLLG